jgi:hypothetical protein
MLGPKLRLLFVIHCNMGAPAAILWDAFRDSLSEDHLQRNGNDPELAFKLSQIEIDRRVRRQWSCWPIMAFEMCKMTAELGRELMI